MRQLHYALMGEIKCRIRDLESDGWHVFEHRRIVVAANRFRRGKASPEERELLATFATEHCGDNYEP